MSKETNLTPIQSDLPKVIPHVDRVTDFISFAHWFAAPREERRHKTQKDFAKAIGVSQDTLTDWKTNPCFWPLVQQFISQWMKEIVPEIISSLANTATGKGKASEVKLFLQLAGININQSNKPKK